MAINSALEFPLEEISEEKKANQSAGSLSAPCRAFHERIKIVGVGGGGNNALDHIIRAGAKGVEFLAVNTDIHCLERSLAIEKLILGEKLTRGLGAGAKPDIGEKAAIESKEDIRACLKGCDMVYLAAGMGGGTGTGAVPVIANIAKEMGILTVSIVTRPFTFEGRKRKQFADEGIEKLKDIVDALIVVPNDRLLQVSERTTSLSDAFAMADNILRQAVQGVTDLVTKPGMINVDFADLRSVMKYAGTAVMGVGTATGERRAEEALKRAMESPLMECSMQGAKGVLFNVTGGHGVGLIEIQEVAAMLEAHIDPEASFVWGWVPDDSMGDAIQMIVIATGFEEGRSPHIVPAASELPAEASVADKKTTPSPQNQPGGESIIAVESILDTPSYMRRKSGK